MMLFTLASPTPLPATLCTAWLLPRRKTWNTLSTSSARSRSPCPARRTPPPPAGPRSRRGFPSPRAPADAPGASSAGEPSPMYLIALSIRFWNTWRSRARSPSSAGSGPSSTSVICRLSRSWRTPRPAPRPARRRSTVSIFCRRVLIRHSSSSSPIRSVSTSRSSGSAPAGGPRPRRTSRGASSAASTAMPAMFRSGALRSWETARRKSSFSAISPAEPAVGASSWRCGCCTFCSRSRFTSPACGWPLTNCPLASASFALAAASLPLARSRSSCWLPDAA